MPKRLNEQEINDKRSQIIKAAKTVFSQCGYSETTMSKIAKEAGMPVSSLYNYFRNKEDIFRSTGLHEDFFNYRPVYDHKRQAILDVALRLMGQSGYSAVTLDEIAAQLGVSKASFYQFFDSKQDLFSTLLTESPLQESGYQLSRSANDSTCRTGLRSIGQSYLDMGDIPERTAIFRMVLHESPDYPEAGKLFYSEGISKVCSTLAMYIRSNIPDCPLDDEQLKLFSWLFLSSLWASNIMFKVINGTERDFSDQQILNMEVEIFASWLESVTKLKKDQ